jgi:hypothetical protein
VFQLKKHQIAASCKQLTVGLTSASCRPVTVPQLTIGPTNKNLLFEHYQTNELL